MSGLFEDLKDSLESAIAFERGNRKAASRVRTVAHVEIREPKSWSPRDIQKLRRDLSLTQTLFGALLGVGPDAVKAWEQGRVSPARTSLRLMDIFRAHREIAEDVIEVKRGA